jgi:hypothetical protein
MSLSLTIAVIVIADLALLGLLAFVMSRAALLVPHASHSETPARGRQGVHMAVASRRQPQRPRPAAVSRS